VKIIVDTCIWSLALRRDKVKDSEQVKELRELIKEFRVQMIGPIRQEILTGIRSKKQFETLKRYLKTFPDLPIMTEDYEKAAELFNLVRSKGLQGSNTDFLICSLCIRNNYSLFTKDKDFNLFSQYIPLKLHYIRETRDSE
jgi:predicted nucleic acid-binding protein